MAYAREDEDEFVRRVIENKLAVQRTEQEQSKRKLEKQRRRITELDAIIQRLYEDNVTGKLTDERFAKLSAAYGVKTQSKPPISGVFHEILQHLCRFGTGRGSSGDKLAAAIAL